MSQTGLHQFDETLQQTNIWLSEIGEALGENDRQAAYHALRAVLLALRDRLTVAESAHLAAQLPTLIRGIYFDSYQPEQQPHKERTVDEFLACVEHRLGSPRPMDIREATRAVLHAVDHHIDPGQARKVREMLPSDIRSLWPH